MKDRFIAQNVRLLCDLLEQTELKKIPGILLQLDFRKAFDTIEWPMIQQGLSVVNFGVPMTRWIETFYCNESSVINNGFTTKKLKLSRGVTFSICGIFIFHKELKISQFADDASLSSNLSSVQNALLILSGFGNVLSGLKLRESKTKALCLGPQ